MNIAFQNKSSRRLTALRAALLVSASSIVMSATVGTSLADNECGTGTTVTCTSDGNNFTSGITYTNDNQTLNLDDDVSVRPPMTVDGAVSLDGQGSQTLNAGGIFRILASQGNAVDIANATSDITIVIGGRLGLVAQEEDIPVGWGGWTAINAVTSGGKITIDATGSISAYAHGGKGIRAESGNALSLGGGDVVVSTGGYVTVGAEFAIKAVSYGGAAEVNVGAESVVVGGHTSDYSAIGTTGTPSAAIVIGGTNGASVNNDGAIGYDTANIYQGQFFSGTTTSLAIVTNNYFGTSAASTVEIDNNGTINGFVWLRSTSTNFVNDGMWNTYKMSTPVWDPNNNWNDQYTKDVAISDFGSNATFENNGKLQIATIYATFANASHQTITADNSGVYVPGGLDASFYNMNPLGREQAHLVNLDRFVNSGIIDMTETITDVYANNYVHAGDVLVITGSGTGGVSGGGTYVSNGGLLRLDTTLNEGGANSQSDVLVVDGTEVGAGGATTIQIKVTDNSAPGQTTGDGILVVEVLDEERSAAGAFTLNERFAYNLYEYKLVQGGIADESDGNWYLRGDIRGMGFVANAAPRLALQYGATLIDGYHQRRGEPEALAVDQADAPKRAMWGRALGTVGSFDPSNTAVQGGAYDYTLTAFQAGFDTIRKEMADGSLHQGGLYFAIGSASADTFFNDGGDAGDLSFDAYTAGGYWTWIAGSGLYVDVVGQGTFLNDITGSAIEGDTFSTRGWLVAGSIEAGYPVWQTAGWQIEPQAQFVLQYGKLSDATETFSRISFDDMESMRGRIGMRVLRDFRPTADAQDPRRFTAAFTANLWNEFSGGTATTFVSKEGINPTSIYGDLGGLSAEGRVSLTAQFARSAAFFADAGYSLGLGDDEGYAWGGRLGGRLTW